MRRENTQLFSQPVPGAAIIPAVGATPWFGVAKPWYPLGMQVGITGVGDGTGVGLLRYMPFILGAGATLTALAVQLTATSAAGGLLRLGIYRSSAITLGPTTLMLDAGTVAIDAAAGVGQKTIAALNLSLTAGLYFVAQFGGVNSGIIAGHAVAQQYSHFGQGDTLLGGPPPAYVSENLAFGALPATATPIAVHDGASPINLVWAQF